jgi:hypothetical protein
MLRLTRLVPVLLVRWPSVAAINNHIFHRTGSITFAQQSHRNISGTTNHSPISGPRHSISMKIVFVGNKFIRNACRCRCVRASVQP